MSFTVFNNFLLLEDLKILKIQLTSFPKKQVEWKNHNDFCIYQNIINKFMIAATSKGYNFSEYAGYEQWFRNSIKVDSHVDKDEVYFKKENNKWIAMCYDSGKQKYLGSFNSEYKAHIAYQNKLKEING